MQPAARSDLKSRSPVHRPRGPVPAVGDVPTTPDADRPSELEADTIANRSLSRPRERRRRRARRSRGARRPRRLLEERERSHRRPAAERDVRQPSSLTVDDALRIDHGCRAPATDGDDAPHRSRAPNADGTAARSSTSAGTCARSAESAGPRSTAARARDESRARRTCAALPASPERAVAWPSPIRAGPHPARVAQACPCRPEIAAS